MGEHQRRIGNSGWSQFGATFFPLFFMIHRVWQSVASFKQLAVISIHARDECWMPALSKDKLPAICVKTCNFTPLSTYFLRLHPKFQNGEKNSVSFDSYIIFFFLSHALTHTSHKSWKRVDARGVSKSFYFRFIARCDGCMDLVKRVRFGFVCK